jgi:glycine/D-amino acid oxidase-like deaminating enzyme
VAPARRSSLDGDREADVAVLGAGLSGCAVALELARRGRRVVVLESGVVAPGGSHLGAVPTGLRVPYPDAVGRLGREGAREIWQVHRENHECLRELLRDLADDCGYRCAGGFLLAQERPEAAALAAGEDLLREDGFSGEFLDHYMLEARFAVRGFAGGYWSACDAEIDPDRLVGALARAAEELGALVHERSPVLELDLSSSGAEAVTARGRLRASMAVVALGANGRRFVPFLEGRIAAVESRLIDVESDPGHALPSPAALVGGRLLWRRVDDRLRVAAFDTAEAPPLDFDRFLSERLSSATPRVLWRGGGNASFSTDGLPFVGPLRGLPALTVCGHGTLGLSQALLSARWVSEALVTGRDPTPERFKASRDSGPTSAAAATSA